VNICKEVEMNLFVLPLSDPQADLAAVGGKGTSLARLTRAGLPVPDGFHVTTDAYRRFVADNDLQAGILTALEKVDAAQPATLEVAARTIGHLFGAGAVPPEIPGAIRAAYDELDSRHPPPAGTRSCPVAVRSSATAEDLPGASFAGQQDTYLNIVGADDVMQAVQRCWASLWTGRAIAYRLRQGIAPDSVALAIVVQLLVPADAAGILFTANPLTGKRSEAVINAAWGLGEAIVGGLVTPDTITVDKSTARVMRRETSSKQVMTIRTEKGTEERPVPDALKNKAVLSDEQAVELARYGSRIEELYGMPMDIEWTLEGGRFAIVQARPITTLSDEGG
jgi:pyruvate,water dikinase